MQILKANIGLQKIEGVKVFESKTSEKFVAIPVKLRTSSSQTRVEFT
jgi:hypothetical protein